MARPVREYKEVVSAPRVRAWLICARWCRWKQREAGYARDMLTRRPTANRNAQDGAMKRFKDANKPAASRCHLLGCSVELASQGW